MTMIAPATWDDANCRGEDINLFFPETDEETALAVVKEICHGCRRFESCLLWATIYNEEGLWAGTTKANRIPLLPVFEGHSVVQAMSLEQVHFRNDPRNQGSTLPISEE